MNRAKPQPESDVLYSAPAPEVFEAFARRVCRHLGSDFMRPEIVEGLSTFLKVAADIQVKRLNRGDADEVDNCPEAG